MTLSPEKSERLIQPLPEDMIGARVIRQDDMARPAVAKRSAPMGSRSPWSSCWPLSTVGLSCILELSQIAMRSIPDIEKCIEARGGCGYDLFIAGFVGVPAARRAGRHWLGITTNISKRCQARPQGHDLE